MKAHNVTATARKLATIVGVSLTITIVATVVGSSLPAYVISQKGREFTPGSVTIKRGEALQIVNDDGDLRHHAYVESSAFSYDSGDQEPGASVSITFPANGDFDVLCAIHPKMKLVVHVK